MSVTPLKWHQEVIATYGSLANFKDRTTVSIIREKIDDKRKDHKETFELLIEFPDIMSEDAVQRLKDEDAALAALDADLEQWQIRRKTSAV
jgi:hypothetical protein